MNRKLTFLSAFISLSFALGLSVGSQTLFAANEPSNVFSENSLSYEVTLLRSPFPMLRVDMRCISESGKEYSKFYLKSGWSSVTGLENEVHGLQAFDTKGKKIIIRSGGRAGEKLEKDTWAIGKTNAAGEEIKLSYYLVPTRPGVSWKTRKRLVVTSTFAHFTGSVAFLRPKHYERKKNCTLNFKWIGFKEAGWKVASSFSQDQTGFSIERSLDEFCMTSFMAGSLSIVKKSSKDLDISCAIAGTRWNFNENDLAKSAFQIVKTTRAFFKDEGKKNLFIGVIPIASTDPIPKGMAGLGLTDSILLFLNPDESLQWQPDKGKNVLHVIAHEYLHQWLGGTMKPRRPTGYLIWFLEGFSDYYAQRILLSAKEIDEEGFIQAYNVTIEDYLTSAVRELSNHNIVLNYNRRADVRRLPYLRGSLLATLLDNEIREQSNGGKRLDDMIFDMLRFSQRDGNLKWSNEDIFAAIEKFTSKEFVKQMRRYIINGDLIPLPPSQLEPGMNFDVHREYSAELARTLRIKTAKQGGHNRGKDVKRKPGAFIPKLYLRQ